MKILLDATFYQFNSFISHYLDGSLLSDDFRFIMDTQTGRLTIKLSSKSDSGRYICSIHSVDNSSIDGNIDLTIGGKLNDDDQERIKFNILFIFTNSVSPSIDQIFLPESRIVEEGTKVNLMCFINKGDSEMHINWLKNGQTLFTNDKQVNSNHIKIDTNKDSSSILFKSISLNDYGEYTCHVSNKFGYDTRTTKLIVHCKL